MTNQYMGICQCQREAEEQRKAAEERQRRMERIKRRKAQGLQDRYLYAVSYTHLILSNAFRAVLAVTIFPKPFSFKMD